MSNRVTPSSMQSSERGAPVAWSDGPDPFADYVAVLDHPEGQNRTDPCSAHRALKIARAWQGFQDHGVRIETVDGEGSWSIQAFAQRLPALAKIKLE